MTSTQQTSLTNALNALAVSDPAAAANITSQIAAGSLAVGSLRAGPGELGAADGDTILLNFDHMRSDEWVEVLLRHEHNHFVFGENGNLDYCTEASNHAQVMDTMAARSCEMGGATGARCALRSFSSHQMMFFQMLCFTSSGVWLGIHDNPGCC
jgi:hypothetical protein